MELRRVQKEDNKSRQDFLEQLAETRVKETGEEKTSIIRQILNAEKSKQMHQKLNYYLWPY